MIAPAAAPGFARCGHDGSGSKRERREVVMPRARGGLRGAAGAEGLEPPTYGFGDRRSTN